MAFWLGWRLSPTLRRLGLKIAFLFSRLKTVRSAFTSWFLGHWQPWAALQLQNTSENLFAANSPKSAKVTGVREVYSQVSDCQPCSYRRY